MVLSVGHASGRMDVRIPAATDLSRYIVVSSSREDICVACILLFF